MGILEKYHIGLGWCLAQYDFFMDPIYFHITPLSVYITSIVNIFDEMMRHKKLEQALYVSSFQGYKMPKKEVRERLLSWFKYNENVRISFTKWHIFTLFKPNKRYVWFDFIALLFSLHAWWCNETTEGFCFKQL